MSRTVLPATSPTNGSIAAQRSDVEEIDARREHSVRVQPFDQPASGLGKLVFSSRPAYEA
jgi:hypothetical protein